MRFIKEPKSLEFRIKYLLGIVFLGLFSGQCLADGDYNKSSGQLHFMLQCQGCHKANGEGMLGTIPSLLDDGLAMLESKRGREFFIKVPGSSMSPLNNQQLADVLNYIALDLLDATANGHGLPLFTEVEVTQHRDKKLLDVRKERLEVLEEITNYE